MFSMTRKYRLQKDFEPFLTLYGQVKIKRKFITGYDFRFRFYCRIRQIRPLHLGQFT